ncbi:hypothetical protein CEXT_602721 [Caerostris extrusa]|uniref:Uncharacterized protein n=1 Tax=Caerostris extrusa TaxID=172846 RepID=A0AAV4Y3I0_CAEEX|nr:hypothetical protein CEXT_602721 [Caerostris extrusa]
MVSSSVLTPRLIKSPLIWNTKCSDLIDETFALRPIETLRTKVSHSNFLGFKYALIFCGIRAWLPLLEQSDEYN